MKQCFMRTLNYSSRASQGANSFVAKSSRSGDPSSNARKPQSKAEALGQIFTDSDLANRMVRGLGITGNSIAGRVLDPCVGPATFPKAISICVSNSRKIVIDAFDIDPDLVRFTSEWAVKSRIRVTARSADYLNVPLDGIYDFAILNPPYVRQEWIAHKQYYRSEFLQRYGVTIPGTANAYVYFIVKVLADMRFGGRMACIVYDSWQATHFGRWLKGHLQANCSWLRVESVPNMPFDGQLIDATIIYAERGTPPVSGESIFTSCAPLFAHDIDGIRPLHTLFETKRGLRLKQSDFFMTTLANAEKEGAQPFVKKVRLIPGYSVPDDHSEAVLLVTPNEANVRTLRVLKRRFAQALLNPSANVSIMTWQKERPEVWAQHGSRPWAPLLLNYYLRKRPRHIYNSNRIYSDNFYGLTPRGSIPVLAWLAALNSTASAVGLLEQARNQGAGLAKLQLFEYRAAQIVDLTEWSLSDVNRLRSVGQDLVAGRKDPVKLIRLLDDIIAAVLADDRLKPTAINEIFFEVDRQARKPKDKVAIGVA